MHKSQKDKSSEFFYMHNFYIDNTVSFSQAAMSYFKHKNNSK